MRMSNNGLPLPTSGTLAARLAKAGVRTDVEQPKEDAGVEQARYRNRLAHLRVQLMELSADPCATFSDKLVLSGIQKQAERLGNDYPLTAHGCRKLRRVRSREACARRIVERGCPND